jgi:hypothetical protein
LQCPSKLSVYAVGAYLVVKYFDNVFISTVVGFDFSLLESKMNWSGV